MSIEIEAKFLNVTRDAMRETLARVGFVCTQPDFLMRRVVFHLPHGDGRSWARVRDEGGAITVSCKRTLDISLVDGTEEVQIIADDFDKSCRLLTAMGLIRKSYQETRRETWRRGDIEATIDEWPALAPFVEIEAPDEPALRAAAAELGFDWAHALFGAVGAAYETIGIAHEAINEAPRLTFENLDEVLALKRPT